CVFFLRGRLGLDQIINEKGKENCFISEITVLELFYGAESSNNPEKSYKAVNNFVKGLVVIPISSSMKLYAKEKFRLRKQGTPIHDEFDLLIGVTSIEHDLTLVTDNIKDFKRLDGIKIKNWFRE